MDAAIACSASGYEKKLLLALAEDPGKGEPVMVNLAGIIAARGDRAEIGAAIAGLVAAKLEGKPLEVLRLGLEETKPIENPVAVAVPEAPTAQQLAAMEERVPEMLAALEKTPDIDEGRTFFTGLCSTCHRLKGIGAAVGPDLDAEFQRAPEVILRDILFPSEAASPGYETILVKTRRGETLMGIIASESPTSITLRQTGGAERTLLRKGARIRKLRNISLMPAGLGATLTPQQVANVIAFLRQPPK
jgi:putative heme-binding domain-containing protein